MSMTQKFNYQKNILIRDRNEIRYTRQSNFKGVNMNEECPVCGGKHPKK